MAEYIEREAAIKLIREEGRNQAGQYANRYHPVVLAYGDCFGKITNLPIADVVEVRHGEWVYTDKAASWHGKDECSECHYSTADRVDLSYFNYCPNCGTKMDGKGEDNAVD